MHVRLIALDYDGTLAHRGRVDNTTWSALEGFRHRGGRLVMVTGREREELEHVCPRLDLFHWIVAENGALVFRPGASEEKIVGARPPKELIGALRWRRVDPLSVGRVVISTLREQEAAVASAAREFKWPLCAIPNKESVMFLPPGVDKGRGLDYVLRRMGVPWQAIAGVGDAENDLDFLTRCGSPVAVANALPEVKQAARWVTRGSAGAGVAEFVNGLTAMHAEGA